MRKIYIEVLSCIALLAAAGCAKTSPPAEVRYPLHGEVEAIDPVHHLLTVHHGAILGYMPAMTMEFPVAPGDTAIVTVGEHIRADLVVTRAGHARLEKIWPDDTTTQGAIDDGERSLELDTHERGNAAYREVGETIPDFALLDQNGKVVESGRFRGQMIMLNFIYSRCPIADMCPLSTAKMMETQKLARQAGIKDIQFVSITLDPANDTPGVLHDYAANRHIDTSNFSFLTGPNNAIRDLLTQFGVVAQRQKDILQHTLATLLIDEHGRIIWRVDGSQWEPKDFVARMHRT